MCHILIHRQPAAGEELDKRSLLWHSHVCDYTGFQLGVEKHIDCATWDSGPTRSMSSWCEIGILDVEFIASHYEICRGVM